MKKLWATFLLGLYLLRVLARQALVLGLRLFGYRPPTVARHLAHCAEDGLAVMPREIVDSLPALSSCIRCGLCEAHCPMFLSSASLSARGPSVLFSCHSRGLNELAYAQTAHDLLRECQSCAACLQVCPQGLRLPRVLRLMEALRVPPVP